jgi:hypothetical protein
MEDKRLTRMCKAWHPCGMNIQDIRKLFLYDPASGELRWQSAGRGRVKTKSAGTKLSNGYIGVVVGPRRYLAHRLCWAVHYGAWPIDQIDHINGDKTDNRIKNLREATNSQNGKNLKLSARNTSGVSGVSFDSQTGKWRACIKVGGKQKYLGRWVEFEDAVIARRAAEEKYFGEWRRKPE